jgi:hypothetical protein
LEVDLWMGYTTLSASFVVYHAQYELFEPTADGIPRRVLPLNNLLLRDGTNVLSFASLECMPYDTNMILVEMSIGFPMVF